MSVKIDLKGKVSVVTGGSSGIGLSISKVLLNAGARVIIIDIDDKRFETVKDEIKKISENFDFYTSNVKNSEKISDTVNAIIAKESKIDILVNNAGIVKDGLLIRMSDEDWLDVINVNLNGMFYITKNVLKHMFKAKSGRIISIASVIGEIGNTGQANYAASKAGIIAFTKSIAKEYAARGILANAIAPGFIRTVMTDKLPEDVKDAIKKSIPLNKIAEPEEIANAVLFLCSELSAYITGTVLNVNGGMYM
ncbi:MAG: 3-oxoacyl-[acyl-carrier-protein] reductase [Candidatus Acidulodesulfobacterium acidiphilum]|uniref:3-oxoacyl-[acyl-carrier-protein] reductase n=1 Tax=Candidatus Acidulodesulfobacterium acidiphilum TaxID=2597224 RepID=A0A520XGN9_9DELT|nr:MAG: 3-oxoacyl-[acyl-carrier-protein] reductase [Candidatus Acidulodesulfobacterium acidiphilum]